MSSDRRTELGTHSIGKLLLRYSMPATVGMVVNSLYNLVDTIFIGQAAGKDALAALTVCFPLHFFMLALAQTVGIGGASIISRSLGAGKQRRAEEVAGTSFGVVLGLSIVMSALILVFLDPILRMFGATDAILPLARDYTIPTTIGGFLFCFAVSTNNVARSEGNVKVAMFSMILGAVTNAVVDPFLIFDWGAGWGVSGAAISTVFANFLSSAYLVLYFVRGKSLLKIRAADLVPRLNVLPEMFSIGASSFARTVAASVLAIVVNNALITFGSELHLAIFGVCNRILLFIMMPLFGLIHGLQPILGFNYGARAMDRARESLMTAMKVSVVYSTACYVLLLASSGVVFRLFGDDAQMLDQGPPILRVLILFLPAIGIQIIGASLFQAIGKPLPALFFSMSRQILFLVPLVLLLPLALGLMGVWVAFPAADLLSTAVTVIWVAREMREFNRLHGAGPQEGS